MADFGDKYKESREEEDKYSKRKIVKLEKVMKNWKQEKKTEKKIEENFNNKET